MQNEPNDSLDYIEPSAAETENQKRCLCPKCQSENTQKLEMAYLSGSFKGTPLGAKIKPPSEPELVPDWFNLLFAVSFITIAWWQGKYFPAAPWTQEFWIWWRDASTVDLFKFVAKASGFGIFGMLVGYWLFSGDLKKRKATIEISHNYLLAKDTWKYGFICHKCGHRFLIRPNP